MSKGSARRPAQVDAQTLDDNWQRIFGNKQEPVIDAGKDKELGQ